MATSKFQMVIEVMIEYDQEKWPASPAEVEEWHILHSKCMFSQHPGVSSRTTEIIETKSENYEE